MYTREKTSAIKRNELDIWLLKHMFQPVTESEDRDFQLLHISGSPKGIWEPSQQNQHQKSQRKDTSPNFNTFQTETSIYDPSTLTSPNTPLPNTVPAKVSQSDRGLTSASSPRIPNPQSAEKMYIITPRTRILSIAQEYRKVFMLDLSSSLATIDAGSSRVMIGSAYKTYFEPVIYITVIAECSQFGSNMNVIPILAKFPTMRVLLQDTRITLNNVVSVLETLDVAVRTFQSDLATFRKQLKEKRAKLGYALDVRGDHSSAVEEGGPAEFEVDTVDPPYLVTRTIAEKEPIKKTDKRKSLRMGHKSQSPRHSIVEKLDSASTKQPQQPAQTTHNRPHLHHRTSSMSTNIHQRPLKNMAGTKKDVWGVGKSGSSLAYILRAGAFILNLQPRMGKPSLILITDGVVKSNLQDESIIQQLSSDDISCSIIQLGSNHKFAPGCNFGSDNRRMTASGRANDISLELSRDHLPHPLPELGMDNRAMHYDDQINRAMISAIGFPWDPYSEPMAVETKLLKYHEYYLPTEFWHAINARIRQGFYMSSIVFDDNRHRRTANGPEDFLSKKERVMITLVLHWQPNITVEYRIQANWSSTWAKYLKGFSSIHERSLSSVLLEDESTNEKEGMLGCMKAPKVEILVRANSTFAHMLQNWDAFQRRSQMMGVVTGSVGGDFSGSPGFLKVGKLKKLLVRMSETDTMMKTLVSMNSYASDTLYTSHEKYVQQFDTTWDKLNGSDYRPYSRYWYDDCCFDLVAVCPAIYGRAQKSVGDTPEYMENAVLQVNTRLSQWATITKKDYVCIKILSPEPPRQEWEPMPKNTDEILLQEEREPIPNACIINKCMEFCEVRVSQDKDRVISVRLLFFNTNVSKRQAVVEELKKLLATPPKDQEDMMENIEIRRLASTRFNNQKHMTITAVNRPLSTLLMRDSVHYMASEEKIEQQQIQINKMWYINSTFWLTGEFIVRNYLYHRAWHWEVQDFQPETYSQANLMGLQSLVFEYLCKARLDQKYILVTSQQQACHFYKEIQTGNTVSAVQYYIWRDAPNKKIITEVWLEPVSTGLNYEIDKTVTFDIFSDDKGIMTQLITFDYINTLGRVSKIEDNSNKNVHERSNCETTGVQHIRQNNMLNISSVLRLGTFLLASYPCPKYSSHCLVQNKSESLYTFATAPVATKLGEIGKPFEEFGIAKHTERLGLKSRYISRFSPASSPIGDIQTVWQSDRNATCTCPRPDELFCQHKDNISKLPPVHRDMALLHYYIEQSLASIVDNDILLKKTPVDNFWYIFIKSLVESKQPGATSTTLHIARNLRDMRCFIKTFDPSMFVVILIPCLDAVVERLNDVHAKDQQPSTYPVLDDSKNIDFDCMSLLVFECHRQLPDQINPGLPSSPTESFDQSISVNTAEKTFSDEWLDSLGTTLCPHLSSGFFGDVFVKNTLSDRTLRLMQDVTRVYSRSFVKSVFTCFLHGRAVEADDFEKVLEICDESTLDIDLTGYLNVQTLLKRRGRTNQEELELAHQRFISVLGHYFEPVILTTGKRQNIYCYRPPFAKVGQKLGFSLSGEKPSNLADVVVCAQNPLFVRLECTLRKPHVSNRVSEVSFPLDHLPSSYEGISDSGEYYNYEPNSIGSLASPVDSADGTAATLHLTCMTLPQVDYDPVNVVFSHLSGCAGDTPTQHQPPFLERGTSHRASLSSLTRDKQDALVETEARLNWLFTEEIMHGLLRSGPITQSVIRYIEAQLMKKNPFVDFPTTMFMPLVFAKNQTSSRQVFFEELEKNRSTPYRLIRVGDCFYASDNGALNLDLLSGNDRFSHDGSETYRDDGLNLSIDQKNHPENDQAGNDEFCQGLGISIFEPETPEEDEIIETSTIADPMSQQLYWLLLIPQVQSVQIYFYSKLKQSVNRSEIIRVTKAMVNEVLERTNKIVLLQNMHDTRVCSKYLLVPDNAGGKHQYSSDDFSDEDSFPDKSGSGDNLVEILSTSGEETTFTPPKKFQPGQFGCDIVYTKRFPLHWRLQPNAALGILSNEVMRPFSVKNRPNMFVCMRDNSVVYYFLSEATSTHYVLDSDSHAEYEGSVAARPGSPYGSSLTQNNSEAFLSSSHNRIQHPNVTQGKTSPPGSISSERVSLKTTSPGKQDSNVSPSIKRGSKTYETRELVLEVHGVDLPSWISEELVDLLENRLTSQITLKEVQQFLTRNPTSKLSRSDIEFILPVDKSPTLHHIVHIPDLVANPIQFLNILKQNILVGPLRAIAGPELRHVTRRHRTLKYGAGSSFAPWQGKENKSDMETLDPITGELCFYYSCSSRTPGICTPFELSAGQGVAGTMLSLLDSRGISISQAPGKEEKIRHFNTSALQACLNYDLTEDTDTPSEYKIGIDIWALGQTNADHIFEHIYCCMKQSICDYIIERIVALSTLESNLHDKNDIHPFDENYSVQDVIHPFFDVLENAVEWKSPSVKEFSRVTSLSHWCMEDILLHIDFELTDHNSSLKPLITRAFLSDNVYNTNELISCYEVYEPSSATVFRNNEFDNRPQNTRFLLVSGLPDMNRLFSAPSGCVRRQSIESEWSQKVHLKYALGRGLLEDEGLRIESLLRRDDISISSRHDSMASGASKSNIALIPKYKNNYKDLAYRNSFLIIQLDESRLKFYAYNCTDSFADQFFHSISRTITQQEARVSTLKNIFHQKMGLFHHTETMADIITTAEKSGPPVPHSTVISHHQHNRTSMSPSIASIARLAQPDTQPRLITANSAPQLHLEDISEKADVNFGSLKQLMTNIFSARTPIATERRGQLFFDADSEMTTSIYDVQDGARLCRLPRSEMLETVYTAVRIADVNTVLRDHYAESTANYEHARNRDYLIRHGEPFLNLYLRRSQIQTAHEKAFKVYTKWADRYSDGSRPEQFETMAAAELKIILKSSRLLHFCRTPLFFVESGSAETATVEAMNSHLFGESATVKAEDMKTWYERLTCTFMAEYASYLEGIGMHLIVNGPANNHPEELETYLSRFKASENYPVMSPVIYLLQVFQGGTIMCEARLTDGFAFVTLYTLHRRYGRLTHSPYTHEKNETRNASFKDFTEECGRFKQRIHVNSFVFDFHLRYIQKSLDEINTLPDNIDILSIIRSTVSVYNKPTSYARNRVLHGLYELDMVENIAHLLPSILRNTSKFGLRPLIFDNKAIACFASSNDLSFNDDGNAFPSTDSPFRHTLIISAADVSPGRWVNNTFGMLDRSDSLSSTRHMSTENRDGIPGKTVLQYFVLTVYREMDRCSSHSNEESPWSKVFKNKPNVSSNPMSEVMRPSNYTLGDVSEQAKRKIDAIINKAIVSCRRDSDWNKIYRAVSTKRTNENQEELIALSQGFDSMKLDTVDPSFGRFLKLNLRWNEVLNMLKQFYPMTAGEINIQSTRHLLLFIPNAVMGYFAHFEYRSDNKSISVYVRSKETRAVEGELDDIEKPFVCSLATTLSYYIWKNTH
ncbi:hypothetical protein J3Q64DRAFT_1808741 [Phycomyces blakesleeanus]